jgi:integrase
MQLAGRQPRRRSGGEGTVYEFRPGAWLAQVRIDGRRLSATGPSSEEARQRLAVKVEAALRAAGTLGTATPAMPTVGEYLTAWIERLRVSQVRRPSAWRRYESVVRLHLVPFLGAIRLDELARGDVVDLLAAARAGRTSGRRQGDTSLHHIHAVLRNGIQQAVDEGLLESNVAALVAAPPMSHRDKVILTAAQAERLLRAARGARLEAAIVLGVATGMREGEILGLRPTDVELVTGCVQVRKNATIGYDGRPSLDVPRTARSRRRIDLPAVAVTALREHLKRAPHGTLTLFPSEEGSILSGTNFLRHHFHPVLRAAGLAPMPFHDLRHSAATILRQMGVDEVTLSEILGHSSLAVTSRLYGHVTPGKRKAAAARMDAALGGAAGRRPSRARRRLEPGELDGGLRPPGKGPSWIPVSDEPALTTPDGKRNGKRGGGTAGRRSEIPRTTKGLAMPPAGEAEI